jgi:hypothetical protein
MNKPNKQPRIQPVDAGLLALDAGLLARSHYPEGPATGHLGTGFFFLGFPVSNSKC